MREEFVINKNKCKITSIYFLYYFTYSFLHSLIYIGELLSIGEKELGKREQIVLDKSDVKWLE